MGKSRKEQTTVKKRPNSRGSSSPNQTMEGEIVTDIAQKQWRIGKSLGSGGFGQMYLLSDDVIKPVPQDSLYAVKVEPHKSGPLFVEMNFYLRVAKQDMIVQWMLERNMKTLGMPHYITFGSHMCQGEKYRFLVLKRFGQDLGKIYNKCKRKFHIKTVLTLGIQILDVLEYIHSHGYIHADIKASNLLLGYDLEDRDTIYLLDYGLACRYIDNWGQHKEYNPDQRKAHDGTLEYTSRDAHVGAHSRRGDLEVLAYNMIQWLSGKLPWEDEEIFQDPEKVAEEKNYCMNNIPLFLKKCFGDEAPAVIHYFLNYVVSLNFDTKPEYEYCKTLLKQGIRQAGYSDDGKLDFFSPPKKLKTKKRYRDADIENWAELKPVKLPKSSTRQPCVPVQQNCNRMTRQQTAANTITLRSRDAFDWVKVLQSNPDKILKSQNAAQEQVKKNRKKSYKKLKTIDTEINITKVKENPMDNPTPAMFEVLKLRNGNICNQNSGKRNRSDSNCSSPIVYDKNTLTPAMEEVIKRRDIIRRLDGEFVPAVTATSARANRLRVRNACKGKKSDSEKSSMDVVEVKKAVRKISAPEPKTSTLKYSRGRRRKYSLPEHSKFPTELPSPADGTKTTRRISQRIEMQKCKKVFPTIPKYVMKRKLDYNQKKKTRRREVSPSEINFVPRLRSGVDTSDDQKILQTSKLLLQAVTPIRHYAAKGISPKVNRVSTVFPRHSLRRHTSRNCQCGC